MLICKYTLRDKVKYINCARIHKKGTEKKKVKIKTKVMIKPNLNLKSSLNKLSAALTEYLKKHNAHSFDSLNSL